MKGVVFTEFLDMVSQTFGEDVTDSIVDSCDLSSDGAYTSVGTYEHGEIVSLVGALSEKTNTPVPDLLRAFGKYLLTRFEAQHPSFFTSKADAFEFLAAVEREIHVEVRKLYPDAELPSLDFRQDSADRALFEYSSPRKLAHLAEGLMQGCIEYYGDPIDVRREWVSEDETAVRFSLTRTPQRQE